MECRSLPLKFYVLFFLECPHFFLMIHPGSVQEDAIHGKKAHASLLYGMVLTLIFREFGVPITNEEPKRLLRHTDHYNLQTLHRMGYRKENGQWVKRGGEAIQLEEIDRAIPEAPPTRPISPPWHQE